MCIRDSCISVAEGFGLISSSTCLSLLNTASHTWHEGGKLGEIAAVEREFRDLASDDNVADVGAASLNHGKIGGDGDVLCYLADLKDKVEHGNLLGLKRDILGYRLKAGLFYFDVILRRRQGWNDVIPGLIGIGGDGPPSSRVCDGDGCSGNDGTGGIR